MRDQSLRQIRKISFIALVSALSLASSHCLNVPKGLSEKDFVSSFTFQPHQMERRIIRLIEEARESITVSLYGFDNDRIADALINAQRNRGIQVRMTTEYDSEEHYSSWRKVIRNGLPVRLGNRSGIMHNKYLIFDDEYIVTGSTNLTSGMFDHFNNTIILKSKSLIEEYKKDFEVLYAGYFASAKTDGYRDLYGADQWQPETFEISKMQITPYFTPYKETIQPYEDNILNSKFGYDSTNPSDPSRVCFSRVSGSNDACEINAGLTSCNDVDYYDNSSSFPGTVYKYHNPDADQGRGRDVCNKYDHALNVVVRELREAKSSIVLLVFAFTDRVIMQELARAKKNRNVNVRVWMERNQYRSGCRHSIQSLKALSESIDSFKITRRPNGGLLHHKVIIIDDRTVILGSMNFSSAAVEKNDENFLLIKNAGSMIKQFKDEITKINKFSYDVAVQPEIQKLKNSNIKDLREDAQKDQREEEVKRICDSVVMELTESLDADEGGAGL